MAKVRFGDSIPPVASTGVRSGLRAGSDPGSWTGAVDPWGRNDLSVREHHGGGGGRAHGCGNGPVVRGGGPGRFGSEQELLLLPMLIPFL